VEKLREEKMGGCAQGEAFTGILREVCDLIFLIFEKMMNMKQGSQINLEKKK